MPTPSMHQILISDLNEEIGSAISARQYEELALFLLLKIIAWKSTHLLNHSLRVATLSMQLVIHSEIGFSTEEVGSLKLAALMHDVGKTGISEHILNKPECLTEIESQWIRQHTIKGSELIQSLGMNKETSAIILSHHENYDGSGYPYGKKAKEIPLGSRILRLADVFDALTNHRAYRPSYSKDMALKIIQDEHSFFDPKLLPMFMEMARDVVAEDLTS